MEQIPVSYSVEQQNHANVAEQAISNNESPVALSKKKRIKAYHRLLKMILHANACPAIEIGSSGKERQCIRPFCSLLKRTLRHMKMYSAGKLCPIALCHPSKLVLLHFQRSAQLNCITCLPIREQQAELSRANFMSRICQGDH